MSKTTRFPPLQTSSHISGTSVQSPIYQQAKREFDPCPSRLYPQPLKTWALKDAGKSQAGEENVTFSSPISNSASRHFIWFQAHCLPTVTFWAQLNQFSQKIKFKRPIPCKFSLVGIPINYLSLRRWCCWKHSFSYIPLKPHEQHPAKPARSM